MERQTLWLQERASDGKLKATMTKPAKITGRLIAITFTGEIHDITDGGFFTIPIQEE